MRMTRLLPLLAVAAAVAPLQATAGTTTGPQLRLSPASGQPGSHFTATFTYSVSRCDLYSVGLWWDDPHYTTPLGAGSDQSTGQFCEVSIDAVVPDSDANPGTTYPVHAYTSPHGASVDGGPGPSGTAAFAVTGAPSTASATASASATAHSGPVAGSGGHGGSPAPGPASPAPQQASVGGVDTRTSPASPSDAPVASASPAPEQTAPSRGGAPPLVSATGPADRPGLIAAVAAAGVLLAAALAWAYRSGRLRSLLRR
jgi:hypothetical protein